MSDNIETLRNWIKTPAARLDDSSVPENVQKKEQDEESHAAFGYLRGIRDRAQSLELRFAAGNSKAFAYQCLTEADYLPGTGLLLKFEGHKINLVLIEGTNLGLIVNEAANLYDRGILRHRVTFLKEMTPLQIRNAGKGEITISRIRIHSHRQDEEPTGIDWLKPFLDRADG